MRVYLTFDVEIWCDGWNDLDAKFPAQFDRYVFGRSTAGQYALPKTLEILSRNDLHAVFFVEPLFAARFGVRHLEAIVGLIRSAGQEVQLHLHPEWTDEISPPIITDNSVKRQHLTYYTREEQSALIAYAKALLEQAGGGKPDAFRAGSFAVNRDTFDALRNNDILIDSSINICHPVSAPELRDALGQATSFDVAGVSTLPISTFVDGFGRLRPAQVGACSFSELREALEQARNQHRRHFVIVSHNFEMLKPDSAAADFLVVRRFERLCAYLAEQRDTLKTSGFRLPCVEHDTGNAPGVLRASFGATARRYGEQIARRLIA